MWRAGAAILVVAVVVFTFWWWMGWAEERAPDLESGSEIPTDAEPDSEIARGAFSEVALTRTPSFSAHDTPEGRDVRVRLGSCRWRGADHWTLKGEVEVDPSVELPQPVTLGPLFIIGDTGLTLANYDATLTGDGFFAVEVHVEDFLAVSGFEEQIVEDTRFLLVELPQEHGVRGMGCDLELYSDELEVADGPGARASNPRL